MKKIISILCSSAVSFLLIIIFLFIDAGAFNTSITIHDHIVGLKYKIVLVDGKKPSRIEHGLITSRVPFVYVEIGKHVLSLELENDSSHSYLLDIEVKSGHHYELIEYEGKPKLAIVNH